jgi:hypothetical protein
MPDPNQTVVRRALSPQEDDVELYYREKRVAQGLERQDAQGKPQKHGLWRFWDYAGTQAEHIKEERYEDGTLLEQHPNVEPVYKALQAGGDTYQQYKVMETAVGSYNAVIFALRRSHQQGRGAPSVALLRCMAEICPQTDVSTMSYLFGQLGEPSLPLLETMAEELLTRARDQDQTRRSAVVVMGLWRIDPTHLTTRFDPLLVAALEGVSFPHFANQNAVYRLGQLIASLPRPRAETILLQKSSYPYYLTSFAWACPTPVVIAALLDIIKGWYRGKHDSNYMYQVDALLTLRRIGKPLVEPLISLLQVEGKKLAQRDLFLIFLAELRAPEAAPVFVEFLADSTSAAKEAARRGLVALGDAALPALQAASIAKKSSTQKAALALLNERGQRGTASKPPAGFLALQELRSSITAEQRARWQELYEAQERDGGLERSWWLGTSYLLERLIKREARRDLRALLFYAQLFLSLCRAGMSFEVRLTVLLELCREHASRSPALLYVAAELLVLAPKDHFFNKVPREYQGKTQDSVFQHSEALKALCRTLGKPLAEPLAYLLSQHEAEEGETLCEWLASPA